MHTANLLDQLAPELIPFILKYLSDQDLKQASSINNIWEREVNLEWSRIILTDFRFRIDIGANANYISEKIGRRRYA